MLVTGNDDRIVSDLGGVFPFKVGRDGREGRIFGRLARTFRDGYACGGAMGGGSAGCQRGEAVELQVPEKELAHIVNMCNGALFDAKNDFANSVWGVKYRLTLPGTSAGAVVFPRKGTEGAGGGDRQGLRIPSCHQRQGIPVGKPGE